MGGTFFRVLRRGQECPRHTINPRFYAPAESL